MGTEPGPRSRSRLQSKSIAPVIVGKVDDDGIRRAADDDPAKGVLFRRIDFHVRRPCGDVKEVSGVDEGFGFAVRAPADERFAFEDVDNGFLFAVVVDAGARTRFNEKSSAPKTGVDAVIA